MAKRNEGKGMADRDPAEPIGMPPGGGRWTWDIPTQAWVDLDVVPEVQQQQVTEKTETPQF